VFQVVSKTSLSLTIYVVLDVKELDILLKVINIYGPYAK
jgi:hypothetical protein